MALPTDDNPDPQWLWFRNPTSRAICWAPHSLHCVDRVLFPATDPSLDGPEQDSPSATVYLAARSDDWSRSEPYAHHQLTLRRTIRAVSGLLLRRLPDSPSG